MDASSYGRMVERGGYATGGFIGEHGPEISFASCCGYIQPAAGLVSRLDTSVTLTVAGDAAFAEALQRVVAEGRIQLPGDRDPDDGTAGVPARV